MRLKNRRKARNSYIVFIIVLFVLVIAVDVSRSPDRQFLSEAALFGIRFYQRYGSPMFDEMGGRCKFTPTCSNYAREAISRYGITKGGWLAIKRIVRCNPWNDDGGYDPVP